MKINKTVVPLAAILIAFGSLAGGAMAQTVNWSKTMIYQFDDPSVVLSYKGPTSGFTTGPTVSGVEIGHALSVLGQADTTISGGIYPPFYVFESPTNYAELILEFDHLLEGGNLARVGSLQWLTDYEISISGGTGTLSNAGVQFLLPGTSTVDPMGYYTGDGTSTIHFHAPPGSISGWDDYYNGQQGLAINGTFDTITIRRYTTDQGTGNEGWDDVAGLTVMGASVVVPEPSSALLLVLGGIGMLARRRW